ncbi:GNAT family N-acetyltransferase [Arcanobacterium ihumii]|uniref:GNAT family N-acetyltransferase n=1 Tax=Arcanobacterium ihumii TaxID=2138162 RepID=UPI000F51D568|nr:GNAT family N-acetyltransferase [Arcanobacterium ihumii]
MELLAGMRSPFWQFEIQPELNDAQDRIIFSYGDEHCAVTILETRESNESGTKYEGTAFGQPQQVIEQLKQIPEQFLGDLELMMNRDVYEAMDDELRAKFGTHWGHEWEFFFATEPIPSVKGDDAVRVIKSGTEEYLHEREAILAVLKKANPISEAVQNVDKLDWFVIPADGGAQDSKLACVMGAHENDGKMHFAGLATDQDYRGRGLASAVMVATVNYWLEQGKVIHFGMWGWNHQARKLYLRLGLTRGARLIIGGPRPFKDYSSLAV